MTLEHRATSCDIPPLGETLAPPCIVLRNRMKLRKVEADQPGADFGHDDESERRGANPSLEAIRTTRDRRS